MHDPEHAEDDNLTRRGPNLTADMPGKVVQVTVTEGQQITVGQTVLIMESMKMETELVATVSGTVNRIHVTPGQVVGQGEALVDIEPAGDPE